MIVNGSAYAGMPCHRSRLAVSWQADPTAPVGSRHIGHWSECTERIVKYIANRPAKNMSSLDNHTIVPTATRFGRVSECTWLDSKRGALAVEVTDRIIAVRVAGGVRGV